MNRWVAGFNRLAADPPWRVRLLMVPTSALIAFGVAGRRGWIVGAIAAVVYGGIGLAMVAAPGGVVAWSRRHPRWDSALLGPVLFLALAYVTPLSIWICALLGVAGVGLGVLMGIHRERRLPAGEERL